MTKKQQINRGNIQKVCHLHDNIFYFINLCHALPALVCHLPYVIGNIELCDVRRKMKIFCIYGWIRVSRYIKGGRESTLTLFKMGLFWCCLGMG